MRLIRNLLLTGLSALWIAPAVAQTAPSGPRALASGGLENIVVTARKREETLISTPVVVSAVGAATLQKYAVTNLDSVARMVPMLMIGPAAGSVQGGEVLIRGIAGPDSNPFGDQAVSFNVDGVAVSMATVRRMADTDISQVEVLKGPQALFYGKNSPGGVITIHTADPTNHFEAKAQVGYEFNDKQIRGEGYVSGPATDALGFRIAGFYSHSEGWLKDASYGTTAIAAAPFPKSGRSEDFAVGGTAKFDPGTNFDAKLKLSYGQTKTDGTGNTRIEYSCPFGARQSGSGLPCDGKSASNGTSGPVVGTIPGTNNFFGDGKNFQNQKQLLGSLELNYNPSDALKMTSVTGYYWVNLNQCQNFEPDTALFLPSCNPTKYHQFSEEIRFTSDYQGAVNFAAGGYFGHTTAQSGSITYLFGTPNPTNTAGPGTGGLNNPILVNDYLLNQTANAYSAYLQLIYKPIEVIEIDGGGRYSYEKKSVRVRDGGGLSVGRLPGLTDISNAYVSVLNPTRTWTDFSPEVTISYRPSRDLTVFGSFKHGFLSGGFNASSASFVGSPDIGFDPETIKGFEIGLKSLLFDETLGFNIAAYTYKMAGLQVTSFLNALSSIHNAASANIRGGEAELNYRTPLDGLSVHGTAAYNRAYYTSFPNSPCYVGQTNAQGCVLINNTGFQSLAKRPLTRAPQWNLAAGFDYEIELPSDLKLGLSADATHSSKYYTDPFISPQGLRPGYTLFNTSVRLGRDTQGWELAFVGNNLTNKLIYFSTNSLPFTGVRGGAPNAKLGDYAGNVSRGRELWIRASYKFGS